MKTYSFYCIWECPIGKPASDNIIAESGSAFDAAFDMQMFVDEYKKTCSHEAERIAYDTQRSKEK